jgi:membrane protein
MREPWALLKEGFQTFLDDEVLSRGAAIAFYATTALVPILYISALLAGFVFGREAASTSIAAVIGHLVGSGAAKLLTTAIYNSHDPGSVGRWRNGVTLVLLIVTATGVFAEIQSALNRIWDVEPRTAIWWQMLRARLASLALVLAFAFLLLVSLLMTAAINALGERIDDVLPVGSAVAWILIFAISFGLIALLLAAIYRVLPDTDVEWRDVAIAAIGTTVLLNIGEYLIGLYLGSAHVGARYGTAGSVIVLLTWIYYTVQIFLLGAVFTRVWSEHHGSRAQKREHEIAPTLSSAS